MKTTKRVKKVDEAHTLKVRHVVSFGCIHEKNVTAISQSLARAGRFINITHDGDMTYSVNVFERV